MSAQFSRIAPKELLRQIPAHTFFITAYQIVSLLAFNIDQIYAQNALKPLLISLIAMVIVLFVLRILTKNWQLAGVLASLLVIWFFLYGRLYTPLKSVSIFGFVLGRHRYLLIVWSGLILAVAFWLTKRLSIIPSLTMILNIFSAILICLPLIQIVAFYVNDLNLHTIQPEDSINPSISWTSDSIPPDIYYIVLDGYVRADVLKKEYGIDNTEFLVDLQDMGFFIANCSQSNYTRTLHSLSSTFNMEYIQDLEEGIKPDQDSSWLLPYLKQSEVRKQLEMLGYKTIVFKNPWERYIWDDAAIVFRSSGTDLLSPFEYLLLRTTVARVYLDFKEADSRQLANFAYYEDTLYALKQLPKVPAISGSKFVFIHLMIPHPPFVFGSNGEKIDIPYDADAGNIYTEEDFKRGYAAAVSYINKRMLEIIPQVIQASKTPPIIVIAGDHGMPWGELENNVRNLAVFYTPASQSPFYETISPVNIFRVLFDTFFNGNYGLLLDRGYLFTEKGRFDFQEIPNVCDATD